MRCKSCGGQLHHLVTTVDGRQLYQCRTGLTRMGQPDDNHQRVVIGIVSCGLVHDNRGSPISGKYVYRTYHGDRLIPEALTVRSGSLII